MVTTPFFHPAIPFSDFTTKIGFYFVKIDLIAKKELTEPKEISRN